jgi:hypothetical protein
MCCVHDDAAARAVLVVLTCACAHRARTICRAVGPKEKFITSTIGLQASNLS